MSAPKSLLDAREGRTQTNILAAIAEAQFHDDVQPRQRDLVDRLPISKGAVSNNCSKLVESELIIQQDKKYSINEDALLDLYREHVDEYLVRESHNNQLGSEIEVYNEARTTLKRELREQFEDNELILSVVSEALVSSKNNSRCQTLRDVFHHADQIIQQIATHIITSETFETDSEDWNQIRLLLLLAVSLTHVHEELDAVIRSNQFLNDFIPGTPPETAMTNAIERGTQQ